MSYLVYRNRQFPSIIILYQLPTVKKEGIPIRFERYHQLKVFAGNHPDRLATITEEELLSAIFPQECEGLPSSSDTLCSHPACQIQQGGESA